MYIGGGTEDARLRPIRLRSKLAEVEIGRSRNWPKSKLIGRSRTDGVCSVSSFSLSFLVWWGRRGSHTTAREPKRAHFRVPALQTPPEFNEKTPRETQKERNGGAGKGRKRAKFWAVRERAVRRRTVPRRTVRRKAVQRSPNPQPQ